MYCKSILILTVGLARGVVHSFTLPKQSGNELLVTTTLRSSAAFVVKANDMSPSIASKNDDIPVSLSAHDQLSWMAPACAVLMTAAPAEAADTIPTALWAYVHYVSMMSALGAVVGQRFVIKPSMSEQDESLLGKLNIAYALSLLLILVSGYFRVSEFGKGAAFYSHEILFWLKMSSVGVLAGLALFPTVILVKRAADNSEFIPMSDPLVERMGKVFNAEISGFLFIPFFATFMARGVAYIDGFPVLAGAAMTVLATAGASFLYGKQSLTWEDPAPSVAKAEREAEV